MSKFNVGDLALTIYPVPGVPAGTVVDLLHKLSPGEAFKGPDEADLHALALGWICARPGDNRSVAYAETSLMPLRGDFEPEQQKAKAEPCA
ncbi:hypothetical protein [Pseudomonas asiatica]|uniref:hypothetical protein n=1 Tax=Pseudomonas asiatica TaxID=2219225 RepID=UPI0010C0E65C|nr:hypothetical protein [Pseudomonas asiatica]